MRMIKADTESSSSRLAPDRQTAFLHILVQVGISLRFVSGNCVRCIGIGGFCKVKWRVHVLLRQPKHRVSEFLAGANAFSVGLMDANTLIGQTVKLTPTARQLSRAESSSSSEPRRSCSPRYSFNRHTSTNPKLCRRLCQAPVDSPGGLDTTPTTG
jgi:hypothetical protein